MKNTGKIIIKALLISFMILLMPFLLIGWLICVFISIVFQPYFYRRDRAIFDKAYNEARQKGAFIDYPPTYGWVFGPGSIIWKYIKFTDEDGDENYELT